MKKLGIWGMMLLSVILSAGCSKDDTESNKEPDTPSKPEDQLNYTIAAKGGSTPIAFEADADWEASVEYANDDSKWLTLTPESGKAGAANITITAEPNTSTAKREASVRILCGGKQRIQSYVFSVVQFGISGDTDITVDFDPLFAQELQNRGYIADAKNITIKEVKGISKLDVSGKFVSSELKYDDKLTSLRGIEYFESLTGLSCAHNQLTTLDVSKNTALTDLDCDFNQLTTLDVSKNTALTDLHCSSNQLTALDVSKNTALKELYCRFNPLLTMLDVSKHRALKDLRCDHCLLTALDVSRNTELTVLFCGYNQLTSLDVSKNTALADLFCSSNHLTVLDVSKNTALTYLECSFNPLTTLDVSKNTALKELHCEDNQLTALDVSKHTALTYLRCRFNQLTTLDVSKNTALTVLNCECNQLTTLDVSKNTALTKLDCDRNPGDGAVFPVTAWFDNNSIPNPENFTTGSWDYNGKTVRIDYRKAN